MTAIAGVIANPASGKDIRRLVAHASVFGNEEKINIVRRLILGMQAAGVRRILYMPDPHRLVPRALDGVDVTPEVVPVEGRFRADAGDTTAAAAAMQAAGARVIVSLGGDGTNRALAKSARDVPLVPISTGTNNVFPVMVEATVAGLAAGAVAAQVVEPARVAQRCKLIEIELAGELREIALIDAVVMQAGFAASRAIWETSRIREVVLTRAQADAVGMAAVGGMLHAVKPCEDVGLHLLLGEGPTEVEAAIAPGLIQPVRIARVERLELGAEVQVRGPALLALDGERELALTDQESAELRVVRSGPPVVDIGRCLAEARQAGFLRRTA
jgi:predicted polyphosphate/ATP-dependent NAD kinase